ncbi:hypothetical protein [Pelosinus baikalensis]|uniref:HTH cro/C1-type domain-containing protein n=1 Tax=Pelosinus baikalensis TaxID=2892015 RepID=A0ABS8HZD5_9FIRM|nr:hypothetical protein [Pelosinus baikalensis]MCC5468513.1 hypothetical protein [Pelosinus baikalensis]
MAHIGDLIRKQRNEMKMSAEYIAKHLAKPMSKQAFAKKERTGNFSFELVKEVAKIIGCNMDIFLPTKSTKRVHGNNLLDDEQSVTLTMQEIPFKPRAS